MTPRDKAKELIDIHYNAFVEVIGGELKPNAPNVRKVAARCAIATVDEITKECNQITQSNDCAPYYSEDFWGKVKSAINIT